MFDLFNLGEDIRSEKLFLFSDSNASTSGFQQYYVPRGAAYVFIMCIGAGAAGGGGRTGAAGGNRGGGGGGAAGVISKGIFPASIIPEILYIKVGKGGASSAANTNGNAGANSSVCISTSITSTFRLLDAAGASGGGAGSTSAAGVGAGAGGTSIGTCILSILGKTTFSPGAAGIAGGLHTGAVGGNITQFAESILSGGAGGAGTGSDNANFAGGDITAAGVMAQTIPGGAVGGGAGLPGFFSNRPLFGTGGSGGGSNGAAGVGGRGGNGAIGCGGGGGGAGVTGGASGAGGDGLVYICCI